MKTRKMNHPLKRHAALQPLSRDHHHGLLLCWKIREGLKKEIEPERIHAYVDYFYHSHLKPHFQFEESEIFSLLGDDHPLVKRAVRDHHRLEHLCESDKYSGRVLSDIQEELEAHIRFEERVLFNEIQHQVSQAQLEQLKLKEDQVETTDPDDWSDKFWERGRL